MIVREKTSLSGWGGLLLESKSPHISMLGPPWLYLGAMVAGLGTSVKHAAAAADADADDLHT
jgi:hypothetical protein